MRIPLGILGLLSMLGAYALVVARYLPELVGTWPAWAQAIAYLLLGIVWLMPLRRFLIWMETGRWSPPRADE
ncbi:hypothetical protein GCM10011515_09220 [Tsuneonella deserti]|uniref:DUF2842 domain-containing protein n=1 Tax=Tsuneonella deserti TaxID=2035528 RepID=A0ABQ1S608_9SPHN|nr:hypothetical protein GCM10011515_09220 [Tsuneonella deserti]